MRLTIGCQANWFDMGHPWVSGGRESARGGGQAQV